MRRVSRRQALVLALFSCIALLTVSETLGAAPPGGGGPRKGTIVGEVVGASGPSAGASVLLFDGVAMDQVDETFSDADGNFQFRRLAAGTYAWNKLRLFQAPPV